jgi:propionyl-CoA carboxylase alpha chain
VEFIVDGEGADQVFYFLEMNTRLQVEHPVTEETTGLDLVEWQIRVARGEELPLAQSAIRQSGHAIEVRLYAEDPANGYLPNTGRIQWFGDSECGVRVDSGVRTGSEISPFYDPMLAKVICGGSTRAQAAAQLAEFLELFEIAGVRTNRESLAAILRSPAFLAGDTTTAFLDENPQVLAPLPPLAEMAEALIFGALGLAHANASEAPWRPLAPLGWRNIPAVPEVFRFGVPWAGGEELAVEVRVMRDRSGAWAEVHGLTGGISATGGFGAAVPATEADAVAALLPGAPIRMRVEAESFEYPCVVRARIDGLGSEHAAQLVGDYVMLTGPVRSLTVRVLPRHPEAAAHGSDHGLATPVPGTVTAVLVIAGQQVSAGDTIVVLEAMKMEHRIRANADGAVTEVRVQVGDSVEAHHIVAVVE